MTADPVAVASHPRVQALGENVRRAYFALFTRLPAGGDYDGADLDRVLAHYGRGPAAGLRTTLLRAGLLAGSDADGWVPVTPEQAEGAAVFGDPAVTWRVDALETAERMAEAGTLGSATADDWNATMDNVSREHAER